MKKNSGACDLIKLQQLGFKEIIQRLREETRRSFDEEKSFGERKKDGLEGAGQPPAFRGRCYRVLPSVTEAGGGISSNEEERNLALKLGSRPSLTLEFWSLKIILSQKLLIITGHVP